MTVLITEILKQQNLGYNETTKLNLDRLLKFVLIDSIANGGDKFHMLKELILDNKFLKRSDINKVLDTFCMAQKCLYTLMRFCKRVNYKYARIYDYNMDMAMTPLSNYKVHLTITLLENNTKYKFKLGDMITLVHKRLCNSSSFFPEPLDIVNPYTNIPLSYSNLYKLYFTIKASNYTMPTLFHQFYLFNFNLETFLDFNECLLKEHIIIETNKTTTLQQKNKRLSAMLYMYRNYFNYKDYLENRLVVLEHISYLHLHYLRSKYSLNPNVRFTSERAIKSGLKKLRMERGNIRQKNNYRRIASDIDSASQQNTFLFNQLNEVYDDNDYDNVTEEDELHDELDDEVDESNEFHDEGEVTTTTEFINATYQINSNVVHDLLNAMTDISFNMIPAPEISSESGDNTDEYDAIISVTPEENSSESLIDDLAGNLITNEIADIVREVFGDSINE